VIGLAAAIALDPARWWVYLVAAVGAALFLFILALIWPGGMGGGDIKLALFMGGVLGPMVIAAMFLAFLFGALVGLVLIASKLKSRKDAIPFGPYLALGSVLALLYGPWLVHSYLGLIG
jgi:prepilin signal peptidase PulO-like enzyme (type II secretory pathway)